MFFTIKLTEETIIGSSSGTSGVGGPSSPQLRRSYSIDWHASPSERVLGELRSILSTPPFNFKGEAVALLLTKIDSNLEVIAFKSILDLLIRTSSSMPLTTRQNAVFNGMALLKETSSSGNQQTLTLAALQQKLRAAYQRMPFGKINLEYLRTFLQEKGEDPTPFLGLLEQKPLSKEGGSIVLDILDSLASPTAEPLKKRYAYYLAYHTAELAQSDSWASVSEDQGKWEEAWKTLQSRAEAATYAEAFLGQGGGKPSFEEVVATLKPLDTPQSCHRFATALALLQNDFFHDIRSLVSLEEVIAFAKHPENADPAQEMSAGEKEPSPLVVMQALKLIPKKVTVALQAIGITPSNALLDQVNAFKTEDQIRLFSGVLAMIGDSENRGVWQSDAQGTLDFVTRCVNDILLIETPLNPETFEPNHREITERNYRRAFIFPDCVAYIRYTHEGKNVEDLEKIVNGFTPEVAKIFLEGIQIINFKALLKGAPTFRLSDLIAFCQDERKRSHYQALASSPAKADYLWQEVMLDAEHKIGNMAGRVTVSSQGSLQLAGEVSLPLRFASLSLSANRTKIKSPFLDKGPGTPEAPLYQGENYQLKTMLSHKRGIGKWGMATLAAGGSYAAEAGSFSYHLPVFSIDVFMDIPVEEVISSERLKATAEIGHEKTFRIGSEEKPYNLSITTALALSPHLLTRFLEVEASLRAQGNFGNWTPSLALVFTRTPSTFVSESYAAETLLETNLFDNPHTTSSGSLGIGYTLREQHLFSLYGTLDHIQNSETINNLSFTTGYTPTLYNGRQGKLEGNIFLQGALYNMGKNTTPAVAGFFGLNYSLPVRLLK